MNLYLIYIWKSYFLDIILMGSFCQYTTKNDVLPQYYQYKYLTFLNQDTFTEEAKWCKILKVLFSEKCNKIKRVL